MTKNDFQQSNSYANLVNLVQNTNELYKNIFHSMRIKIPQKISCNHIKIIGSKHENTSNTQFYQPIRIRASIDQSNITIS